MNAMPMRTRLWRAFHQLGSPPYVYRLAGRLAPWLGAASCALLAAGAFWGLVLAPPDYLQGDSFRIIYIHVPSAYLSMGGYVLMAAAAGIGYIWRMKLAHAVAVCVAPLGAWFTALALVTGGIWGKPTWGTYWEWGDARLMFELLLLFLYIGYMVLRMSFDERDKADRVSALLAVVGVVNVPIIHYSVEWWTTLHQGPTLIREGGPSIAMEMLIPLLIMLAGFSLFFGWLLCKRLQGEILRRESRTRWVRNLVAEAAA